MSVVLSQHSKNFIYPTPYELHFSNECLKIYFQDPLSLCNDDDKRDPDLAAHFTIIKHVGIVRFGSPISEVFGDVPKEHYIDSIYQDIKNAKKDVIYHPVYVILNLCRVLAYLKDGSILSKEQGAHWGLNNTPDQFHALITEMLTNYKNGTSIATHAHQYFNFCHHMLNEITRSKPYASP